MKGDGTRAVDVVVKGLCLHLTSSVCKWPPVQLCKNACEVFVETMQHSDLHVWLQSPARRTNTPVFAQLAFPLSLTQMASLLLCMQLIICKDIQLNR